MVINETYKMNSGYEIPKLALGTWLIPNEEAVEAVKTALSLGYRHIDSAQGYGNEEGVGRGIKESGVAREEVFVTSKVLAETKTYEGAAASIDETLAKLGMDYVDMMLIHCPQPWDEYGGENKYYEENRQVWKAMEEAVKAGKIRTIGVSNFSKEDIQNILEVCEIKPAINQVSCSILRSPLELIDYCESEGILVEAYCPNTHGEAFQNAKIAEYAAKYGVSVAQLCIRYTIQLGTISLPKTTNPDHMKENTLLDFEISAEDMEALKHFNE